MRLEWRPHKAQYEIFSHPARFKIVACGRRFGKTLGAWMDLLIRCAEKGGLTCWWIAPVYKELGLSITPIVRQWTPVEAIDKKLENQEVIRYVRLVNGSEIWFHSADDPDTLRGAGLDYVVVDEPAQMRRIIWNDVLRPALTDRKGGATFISTPKGRNWFYEIWSRGQDPNYPDYKSWSFSSEDNPYLDKVEIAEAQRTLPELVFRQEYLAHFLDDVGAVFKNIDAYISGSLFSECGDCVVGVDLGKHMDFTVMMAMDRTGHVVGFERLNQVDWGFIKEKIKNFSARYHGPMVLDSSGVGDPIFDDLYKAGLNIRGYKFTAESKKDLVQNLILMLDNHRLTYPEIPELQNELKMFTFTAGVTGQIRYGAPEGYHDDCVIALGLAAWGLGSARKVAPIMM